MRVSWKWLSELIDLSGVGGPEGLAQLLTSRGIEVEEIAQQDRGFEKVVTAQILERNPHPQSDRLSLCKVTIGQGEPLEIVCGAQNMKAGDRVALAQIGADLPNGLKIAQSKIRGVTSNGMLCSEEELKLKDSSEGIMILPPSTPLGKPLAEILGLDDTVFTLKLTANRADCLSHFGLAREIGAAIGKKAKRPSARELSYSKTPISIHLDAGEAAPQFLGCMIEGVKIGPSPEWVVRRLEALGSRSINNVVDASNLAMFETGHPMHAYDATQIEGSEIRVRMAREGESLPLLDGKSVTLQGFELVIADGKRAIGLAGVMGGGNSEVQDSTTRVFLECAEFNPSLVRKASSIHQRKTDAAHRFERGIDPEGATHAIARLATLIVELAGGEIKSASAVRLPSREPATAPKRLKRITVNPEYFPKFLGMSVDAAMAEQILTGLECKVEKAGSQWTVIPPSYRLDLGMKEDLAEEIARTLGYDKIQETVPPLTSAPKSVSTTPAAAGLALLNRAKDALVRQGLLETINFSFTSRQWLTETGMSSSVVVTNPLSEEHEALVPSLVPGVIKNALDNWSRHFGSESLPIRLFEIRPTFHATEAPRAEGEMATNVQERWRVAFALSGPRYASGLRNEQGEVDFYDLKSVVEGLFEELQVRGVRMQPASASRTPDHPVLKLLHPGQSAEVLAGAGSAGFFGLLHPAKAKQWKVRTPLWIGELDWDALAKLSRPVAESRSFKAIPQFPGIERDFALLVKSDVSADKITQVALKAGKPLAKSAKVFDVYRGTQVAEGMTSVAVHVVFFDETRSLQEAEAEAASAKILEAWKKELSIELR